MDWVKAKALQRRRAAATAGCFLTIAGLTLGLAVVILIAASIGWGSH